MKLYKIIQYLESIAPSSYQESYDNAGLIVGDPNTSIKGVLVCLDSTEAIVDEAKKKKCNVIIAHHPIVFKGLKKLNGKNYVERTIIKAIKNDICIYAIHTNLDNVYHNGVNTKIAQKLGLKNQEILSPKQNMVKFHFYLKDKQIKVLQKAAVRNKVHKAFNNIYSLLAVNKNVKQDEALIKCETTVAANEVSSLVNFIKTSTKSSTLKYDSSPTQEANPIVGSGVIGSLANPILPSTFFKRLKSSMELKGFRHTAILDKKIQKIAVCGGSGGFLLPHAIRNGADIFITSDYKYHEFFDADGKIIIADIGHYESEQYTIELLHGLITKKFSNFASHCTKISTNPVFYY